MTVTSWADEMISFCEANGMGGQDYSSYMNVTVLTYFRVLSISSLCLNYILNIGVYTVWQSSVVDDVLDRTSKVIRKTTNVGTHDWRCPSNES
jgi:hypothetical protein